MKLLAFSDLHMSAKQAREIVAASKDADLVIGAGDFCNGRKGLDEAMGFLAGITAPMVAVPGNAESDEELREAAGPGVTVLHGQGTQVKGISLFGLGYGVPETPFGDWSCDLNEAEAAGMLADCTTVDILITHSPPYGTVDKTSAGESVGSTAIASAIERVQPRLALCGHIHDSWGQENQIGMTRVVNLGPFANWFEI